jgi:hypothetical protein
MQKVTRNSRAQFVYNRDFLFKKYRFPEPTAHSNSADANLQDLMSDPTISIPFSASVLKFPVWGTAFVTPLHSSIPLSTMQVSAENNLQRESLNTGSISKCYKNVLHWLKDYTLWVKIIVEMFARSVLRCVM